MRINFLPWLGMAAFIAACSSQTETADPTAIDPVVSPTSNWALETAQSRLSFVSIKAGEVAEVHHFTSLEGMVDADGVATITIPLESVETNVDIRNERMRDILFQVADYPTATITAKLDMTPLKLLETGEQLRMPLTGELDLHGMKAAVETQVMVTRAAPDRVLVATLDPIVINADSFGLLPGLQQLQELANLSGITPDVPVTFQLSFAAAQG